VDGLAVDGLAVDGLAVDGLATDGLAVDGLALGWVAVIAEPGVGVGSTISKRDCCRLLCVISRPL
jgi:hypothetical protein